MLKNSHGIWYKLVGITVTNANNLTMSYPVIDSGVPSADVHASSDGSAETGQSVNFSYLSFGFETDTGSNQNEINIECAVDLFITPVETTAEPTTTNYSKGLGSYYGPTTTYYF